jgi:hypothetical protein
MKPCTVPSPLPQPPGGLAGKLTRRQILAAPATLLGAAATARAQTRQEKGRLLLEQTLAALGGDRFLNSRDIVRRGRAYSFYRRDLRGLAKMTVYDRYDALPGHPAAEPPDPDWLPVSRREVYTEKGDYYSLFRNGQGWEVTFRGARPLDPERMMRYRESVRRDIFYFLRYRLDEPGMYFYHRGSEIMDNTPTDAVEVTDSNSDAMTFFLRRSDHLPVQQIYLRRDPKTRVPFEEKTIYSKFRSVSGLTLPWNIRREVDGERRLELYSATVEVDPKIKPSIYALHKKLTLLPPLP